MKWDELASLPLFIGMSHEELEGIMTQLRIDFKKYDAGKIIVRRGDPCGKLIIVNSGDILCQAKADDGTYSMEETLTAPVMLQTNGIFGRFQTYTHTIKAINPVSTLTFEKGEIQKLLASSLIFRLNLAGMLSTMLQKWEQHLWEQQYIPQGSTDDDKDDDKEVDALQHRIKTFLRQRCLTPAGRKTFFIKMSTLGSILGFRRQQISMALNGMQEQGLVKLSRGKITVEQMQKI